MKCPKCGEEAERSGGCGSCWHCNHCRIYGCTNLANLTRAEIEVRLKNPMPYSSMDAKISMVSMVKIK